MCGVARPVPGADPALRCACCPRCDIGMIAIAPDTSSVVHVCPRCHGLFVPPLAWHALLQSPDRVAELEAKLPPAPAERGDLLASVRCPACRLDMERFRFAVSSGVVVDTCTAKHGSWLDAGELGAIVRFIDGKDTGAHVEAERAVDARAFRLRMESEARYAHDGMRRAELLAASSQSSRGRGAPALLALVVVWLIMMGSFAVGDRLGCRAKRGSNDQPQSGPERATASLEREVR